MISEVVMAPERRSLRIEATPNHESPTATAMITNSVTIAPDPIGRLPPSRHGCRPRHTNVRKSRGDQRDDQCTMDPSAWP